jgi:hypothetical protein
MVRGERNEWIGEIARSANGAHIRDETMRVQDLNDTVPDFRLPHARERGVVDPFVMLILTLTMRVTPRNVPSSIVVADAAADRISEVQASQDHSLKHGELCYRVCQWTPSTLEGEFG